MAKGDKTNRCLLFLEKRCCSGRWLDFETRDPEKFVDDSQWDEVSDINSYAVFMGYLSMSVRGLGFLVVTWTTVVLLGGFVSTIKKKDFWCLTIIVLTETAGVFDIFLKEKLSDIWYAGRGLVNASLFTSCMPEAAIGNLGVTGSIVLYLLFVAKVGIQVLAMVIISSPLVVVYMSGLYVSTAISLGRLIKHDYGDADESGNMKPALDVLYSLALVQGLVYGYRASYYPARKRIVQDIIERYKFDHLGRASVWQYFEDTMSGCEKDPSFARGRNLITYGVDLMESNSPDKFLSGVRILDTIISQLSLNVYIEEWGSDLLQHTLIKHLIGSSSSSPVLQKLLHSLDTRSPCNRETRGRAARIVKHLAGDICLEKLPRRTIQYIASLIGTFEEYRLIEPYQRDWLVEDREHEWHRHAVRLSNSGDRYGGKLWEGYKDLFLQGMCILRKLAADQQNVRAMSHSQGLLSKIMAPVTSDLVHHIDHDEWSSVVQGSLKVISQLVSAPGEAGAEIRHHISGNSEAISTMNRILLCNKKGCYGQKELSMRILTRLYMDTQATQDFIKLLLHEFDDIKGFIGREEADEALAMLSSTGRINVMIILQANDDVVITLRKILLDAKQKWGNTSADTNKIIAAEILEHLCIHYNNNDEYLGKLKEAMIDVMPKVLSEILPEEAAETGKVAGFSSSHKDIEGQHGGASQANKLNKSAPDSKNGKINKLRVAYLSLFVTVCETFISADPDKARQFSAIHEPSLPKKLRELVNRTSEPKAENLRILKLISRMVISMVKHEGSSSYSKQDLENLIKALSLAFKNMVRVDGSMYFASGDGDGGTTTKPVRILASLVREAKETVSRYYEAEESEIMELSTSANGEPR